MYDPKVQRRPLVNLEIKDEALTTMAIAPQERQIIVGTGKGRMNLVDLRNPAKVLNRYKGFAGGVTGIACDRTNPYIFSVSLDRHLRVHHIHTKEMLKKIYLTSKLTCLVLRSKFSLSTDTEEEENVQPSTSNGGTDSETDFEYDGLFDSMQTIGTEEHSKPTEKIQVSAGESATSQTGETISRRKRKRSN